MDKLGNIIHEIESSVDTFVKESGIHQGPPELYRDVFRKMAEVYGAHVWAMVDLNLKMNPKNPSFLELRYYVSQFADSPRRYKSARKVRIPINLDNWKPYEQLKEHPLPKKWEELTVVFNFVGHQKRWAYALPSGKIEIDITLMPNSAKGFKQVLKKLKSHLRHEIAHIGQFIINDMLGKSSGGGLPSKKIRTEFTPAIKRLKRYPKESLKDIEFYTYLGDAVDEFKTVAKNLNPEKKAQLAKYFVALLPFSPISVTTESQFHFQTLRRHAPDKWRKAVKEFFKAVEFEQPGGQVPGETVPTPWSPGQFMEAVQRYSQLLHEDPNSEEAQELLRALQHQESIKN